MYARSEWKCPKGGCPRLLGGRKGPIHSVSWRRHLSKIMALTSISYSTNPKNFWEFWVILEFFGNLQVLASQRVSPPARPFVIVAPFGKNSEFLDLAWNVTLAHPLVRNFIELWASKRSKCMQNLTFCPFFELQKQVLGELSFDRSNDLQIQKFQLGWKLDSQTFPTSYRVPNSDNGKASK